MILIYRKGKFVHHKGDDNEFIVHFCKLRTSSKGGSRAVQVEEDPPPYESLVPQPVRFIFHPSKKNY